MFDEKGQIIIDKEECDMDADDLMMTVLDAGAEDFNEEEDSYEVLQHRKISVMFVWIWKKLEFLWHLPKLQ